MCLMGGINVFIIWMQQRTDIIEKKLQEGKTQEEDDFEVHEGDPMNKDYHIIDDDFEFRKRERPEETVLQQQPNQPEETVLQQQPNQPEETVKQQQEKVHVDEQKNIEKIQDDFFNDGLNKLVDNICQDPKRTIPEADMQLVS